MPEQRRCAHGRVEQEVLGGEDVERRGAQPAVLGRCWIEAEALEGPLGDLRGAAREADPPRLQVDAEELDVGEPHRQQGGALARGEPVEEQAVGARQETHAALRVGGEDAHLQAFEARDGLGCAPPGERRERFSIGRHGGLELGRHRLGRGRARRARDSGRREPCGEGMGQGAGRVQRGDAHGLEARCEGLEPALAFGSGSERGRRGAQRDGAQGECARAVDPREDAQRALGGSFEPREIAHAVGAEPGAGLGVDRHAIVPRGDDATVGGDDVESELDAEPTSGVPFDQRGGGDLHHREQGGRGVAGRERHGGDPESQRAGVAAAREQRGELRRDAPQRPHRDPRLGAGGRREQPGGGCGRAQDGRPPHRFATSTGAVWIATVPASSSSTPTPRR